MTRARHPSAAKWTRWPQHTDVEVKDARGAEFNKFWRAWNTDRDRPALQVYRPELDDAQTPTVGDVRKLFRQVQLMLDSQLAVSTFSSQRKRKEIAELQAKVKELEARKIPQYRGVWQEGQTYDKSDLVTLGGSIWFCHRETKGRPTTNHEDWQLAVKAGRDGRDGKGLLR